MKYITGCLVACLLTLPASAQKGLVLRSHFLNGKGVQSGRFDAIGMGLQFEGFSKRGLRFGYLLSYETNYSGSENRDIQVSFNGVRTDLELEYRSTMSRFTAGGIFMPTREAALAPYLSLQTGMQWYRTKILVTNPEQDPTHCEPIDRKNVMTSFSFMGTAESGVKIRVRPTSYLQLGIGYTRGTRASYVKLEDDMPASPKSTYYISRFKAPGGEIHEHQIGTLYRTSTSQISYNLGWNFFLR